MDGSCFPVPRAHLEAHQNSSTPCSGSCRIALVQMWKTSFGPGSISPEAPETLSSGLGCFRNTWICVPFLSAAPVPSNLSSSSVCKPLWGKDLMSNCPAKSSLSSETSFPPAFDFKSWEISSHCPVAQSWFFSLGSLWPRSCCHPRGWGASTGWFLCGFLCIARCICFCDTDHCRISLCSSDKQIQSLQRNYPGICAVSPALITTLS